LSKTITSIQELDQKTVSKNSVWIIYSFQNINEVSCYANAVLQSILHLHVIRKQLLNYNKLEVLNLFAHQYENGMNTYEIRQSLGEYFSVNIKRNASEFLRALCTKYNYMQNLINHQITSSYQCNLCGNTKITTENNVLLLIFINNLKKKCFNLNDLLKTTFPSHWRQSFDKSCECCGRNDILLKNELILTKEIPIIHLILFSLQDGKLIKIPYKFHVCAVPTTKMLIAGQVYKVMNAIFHHDTCMKRVIIRVCVEKKHLGLKLMTRKLQKSNGLKVLKIFIYYFYKKLVLNTCIK